ncbi:DNA polymerase III subunit gamma/tau [bacterium]|nr:MAG: DNA polymerase III subunit gamma/tau [bacterium]
MSGYVVIARKWRPIVFEEIVGQAHVTRTLKNAISSGRVAHAYLFSGPRGVGKTTAARILAKSLNCAGLKDGAPCGECASCRSIASGSSVEVLEIDGASNNGVENVRELRETVRFMPGQGSKYKVYIIDEVHMLSTPAFNALLKTLEEPPPHAIFVLATTEVHKIPLTILSRCQRFDFRRIPFKEIHAHLEKILVKEGIRFEHDAAALIAREGDGSLRDAQSLLEQAIAFSDGEVTCAVVAESLGLMDRSTLFALSKAIVERDGGECLNIVEKIHDFGYDFKKAAGGLLEHIRDIAVVKAGADVSLELPDGELESLKTIAVGIEPERLQMLFSVMAKGYEDVSRSAYPRYAFEMALLKAASFDVAEPLGALIERLERLEPVITSPLAGAGQTAKPVAYSSAVSGGNVAKTEKAVTAQASVKEADEHVTGSDGFLAFLRSKMPPLSDALKAASLKQDGDCVEIIAPDDKIAVLKFKLDQIASVLKEYSANKALKVIVKSGGATNGALKNNSTDPLIKEAADILGAKVVAGQV